MNKMDMTPQDFSIGMPVFVVRNGVRRSESPTGEDATVTKIGRKWVTIGDGWRQERFDPASGLLDGAGYSSPGTVYLTREDWERTTELYKAWEEFRKRLPYSIPDGVTIEDVAQARALLLKERAK